MAKSLRCLLIGIPADAPGEGSARPEEADLISYSALPDFPVLPEGLELVVAPLFCEEFDALEVIEALGSKGYRGKLRIVAPKLPNRQIVLRELRAHAGRQGITLELYDEA
jgi:hypothetical protein